MKFGQGDACSAIFCEALWLVLFNCQKLIIFVISFQIKTKSLKLKYFCNILKISNLTIGGGYFVKYAHADCIPY